MRWDATYIGRVCTTNELLRMHRMQVHRYTQELKEHFGWLARGADRHPRAPRFTDPVMVTVRTHWPTTPLPDPSGVSLAVKAALDGLVAVDVLDDDDGSHVAGELYLPAVHSSRHALVITLDTECPTSSAPVTTPMPSRVPAGPSTRSSSAARRGGGVGRSGSAPAPAPSSWRASS